MKTISTNSYAYEINWNDYINTDSFKYLEELKKYYTISDGNSGINIFIINNYPPLQYIDEADPCLGCPNRGGPKDVFGNPVVGDSPCHWCQHYKWRITW